LIRDYNHRAGWRTGDRGDGDCWWLFGRRRGYLSDQAKPHYGNYCQVCDCDSTQNIPMLRVRFVLEAAH